MTLVRYNPNQFFDTSFDRFFSDFLPSVVTNGEGSHGVISPRVDISDGEEAIYITAEVPGIDKDQLKIEVNQRVLTLSGEKHSEQEHKDAGIFRSERVFGAFKRGFTLPDEVDVDNIVARTENGVLRITLPKKPESKPKQISIANGESEKIEVS